MKLTKKYLEQRKKKLTEDVKYYHEWIERREKEIRYINSCLMEVKHQ